MLKIDHISFSSNKEINGSKLFLNIKGYQIESFPFVGGEQANSIKTNVWNQHGNTHVNSFMQAYEGEIIFAFYTANMTDNEILKKRQEIIEVCNPLNGTLVMEIKLSNESVFRRDITFLSAPFFPTGFENRNNKWQKVQLSYEANDPFWYSETETQEDFKTSEPLFEFPFELGNDDSSNINFNADFSNKIRYSTIENPNSAYSKIITVLPTDKTTVTGEFPQAGYDSIAVDNGSIIEIESSLAGERASIFFKYNIIEILERKYSSSIWEGTTDLAAKVTKANQMINNMAFYVRAYGENANGKKLTLVLWKEDSTYSPEFVYTDSTPTLRGINSNLENNIDPEGFVWLVAYTDAAVTGTDASIYIEYAYLQLNVTTYGTGEAIVFGEMTPEKYVTNEGQADAPVIIEIQGACVNPKIENVTTGEYISFNNLTMGENDTLIIDTAFGHKKAELNGENIFNKLDFSSTFFSLIQGDNEINFTDDTGVSTAKIVFIYKTLYVTI